MTVPESEIKGGGRLQHIPANVKQGVIRPSRAGGLIHSQGVCYAIARVQTAQHANDRLHRLVSGDRARGEHKVRRPLHNKRFQRRSRGHGRKEQRQLCQQGCSAAAGEDSSTEDSALHLMHPLEKQKYGSPRAYKNARKPD